jgi:WD40 repeat protein
LFVLLSAPLSVPTLQQEGTKVKAEERAAFALEGRVYALAFPADASALACVSLPPSTNRKGEVHLWYRAANSEQETTLVTTLPDTKGMVSALAFAPDGKTLATGGSASGDPADPRVWEGVVRLWETASAKEYAVLKGHTSFVTSLKFSPDGRVLASATQSVRGVRSQIELKLWDVLSRKELATITGYGNYQSVLEFTPDGKILAWGTQGVFSEQTVRREPEIGLVDVATGKVCAVLKGHSHVLKCLAFSPDGKMLASGGGLPPTIPAPDGRTLMLGRKALVEQPGELKLWDVATGQELANLEGHSGCVQTVAFSPDGMKLASGGCGTPMPEGQPQRELWYWSGEVKLWDPVTGKELVRLRGHPFPRCTVEYVRFSTDSTTLASAGGNAVKLWDTASGRERAEVIGNRWDTWIWVAFNGKGMVLLSRHQEPPKIFGAPHEGLTFWDVPTVK